MCAPFLDEDWIYGSNGIQCKVCFFLFSVAVLLLLVFSLSAASKTALRKCIPQQDCGTFIDITACCVTILHNLICVVWCSAFQLLQPWSEPNAPVALHRRHRPRGSRRASQLTMHSRDERTRELLRN